MKQFLILFLNPNKDKIHYTHQLLLIPVSSTICSCTSQREVFSFLLQLRFLILLLPFFTSKGISSSLTESSYDFVAASFIWSARSHLFFLFNENLAGATDASEEVGRYSIPSTSTSCVEVFMICWSFNTRADAKIKRKIPKYLHIRRFYVKYSTFHFIFSYEN